MIDFHVPKGSKGRKVGSDSAAKSQLPYATADAAMTEVLILCVRKVHVADECNNNTTDELQ